MKLTVLFLLKRPLTINFVKTAALLKFIGIFQSSKPVF